MAEFKYSNVEKEIATYGFDKVIKSHCRMCHGGCGVLVYTKKGKAVKISGDPDCPINHGTLCTKGFASLQLAYHPDRLTYPVRRVGPKGSGKWERISWDAALDLIADRILDYKKNFGAESVVMGYGTGRENEAVIYRFANLLGTPNVLTAGHLCYGPRIATSIITCGSNPILDYENHPQCVMVWGNNIVISNPDEYKGESFSVSVKKGAKLIAVDPRLTRIAARADIWLQLRPGTDTALALGMLNVIVNEELYDKEFVDKWCYGFEQVAERAREYAPEKAAKICWVSAEEIRAAARMYATSKPAFGVHGMAKGSPEMLQAAPLSWKSMGRSSRDENRKW